MNNTTDDGVTGNITGLGPGPFLYKNTYEVHRIAAPELLIVDRVITPIWYIIGAIGNPLSAGIWLSKKVRGNNSSALYLGSIAIVHTMFIFLHVWVELQQAWGLQTYNRPISCEIFMVLYITPQYLAPILILGFTFERYIAICHPFLKEKVCTVKRATTVIISMAILAVLFGLCQAYVWSYDYPAGVCEIRRAAEGFYEVWTWFSEMLVFVAVPLTVLLCNILVIREIKRINKFDVDIGRGEGNRGSNQTSTITLLSVSFYLICTLLPATIVYTIQLSVNPGNITTPPSQWAADPTWNSYLTYYHIRRIVEELCFSNYACYGIIYYITSKYFRKEVHRLCCCFSCKKKSAKETEKTSNYSVLVVTTNGTKNATSV